MKKMVIASLLVLGLASVALAQIDVNMAFDPAVAAPGDQVTFFTSIANLGDEDVIADIAVTVAFADYTFGPVEGQLPLAAGQELSREFTFMVPPLPYGGTLTITVTATAGDFTDTATATLTVEVPEGGQGDPSNIDAIGEQILNELQGTLPAQELSFSNLKALYR